MNSAVKTILLLLLVAVASAQHASDIVVEFPINSQISINLYKEGYEMVKPNACLNPSHPNSVTANIAVGPSFTCGTTPSGPFMEVSGNATNFNALPFLENFLNPADCSFNAFQMQANILAMQPTLSSVVVINVIEADVIVPPCNLSMVPAMQEVTTINLYVNDSCLASCPMRCSPTNFTVPQLGSAGDMFEISICLDTQEFRDIGVFGPDFSGVNISFVQTAASMGQLGAVNFTEMFNVTEMLDPATGQLNLVFTLLQDQNGFFTFNSDFGGPSGTFTNPSPLEIAVTGLSAPLNGSSNCVGKECCKVASLCASGLASFNASTSSYSNLDSFCTFPPCAPLFVLDSQTQQCVKEEGGSLNPNITHTPYTSFSECANDGLRSSEKHCLCDVTRAFRLCEAGCGLRC